jgi:TonB family protein
MRSYLFARAGNQFLMPLLTALVVSTTSTLVFEARAQTINQTSDLSGFTVVFSHTVTSTDSQAKRLHGIHVRYQRSDCMAKEVRTYFKEDGTPSPPQIQQYLKRDHRSLSAEALRKNPSFDREEEVLGFQTFVLRYSHGSSSDEYIETFLAPELQGIEIKQVVVTKGMIEVIEPVSILLGEPDEKTLAIAPVDLGKESAIGASPRGAKKIDFSGGVLQGYAVKKVQPPYPVEARDADVSGDVQVQVLISEQGKVIEATPIGGPQLLLSAALDAARQWVFKPTEVSGVPVKVQDTLTFNFTPH